MGEVALHILWYAPAHLEVELLNRQIQNDSYFKNFQIQTATNFEKANQILMNFPIAVVLSSDEHFVALAQKQNPQAVRIYISEQINEVKIRNAFNQQQVFRIIFNHELREMIFPAVRAALVEFELSQTHSHLVKESARQNREWEALNLSLEKRVEERTRHIQLSKEEADHNLAKARGLIRFVNDLAIHSSFDEILHLLRKENRSFHNVGDPILIYQMDDSAFHIFYFRSSQIIHNEIFQPLHLPEDITIHNQEFAQILANHLGRPLMKLMTFPISIQLTQSLGHPRARSVVVVESSLGDEKMSEFLDHMLERNRPLSIAVDRALLENEMMIQSYRWEKTFNGLKDPIAIINSKYEVLHSNNKFSDKELLGKCYQRFSGMQQPCEGCPLLRSLQDSQPLIEQIKIKNKIYEAHVYPIRSANDAVVIQYVDVTQERELYMRILQNEKMSAIGILAGNIAHELNNPLTGIRSLAQVLKSEVDPKTALASDLSEIEKAAERSQNIIRNLLQYSENKAASRQMISVDELVERTIPMMKTLIRKHRFELDLNSSEYLVNVEPHLLQQVVFNLVNNACQAMNDSGVLKISTHWNPRSAHVELMISDTGPGIPLELTEKIFEPFFTTKKEGHGTGLGLSFSREIVRNMEGDIHVQSVVGEGSQFFVTLPGRQGSV